jgi:two-component sensor histidine kinase
MMVHELATNAVKYGALSNVRWATTLENSARVRVHWKERGGTPVAQPTRKGFGSRLIEQALGNDTGNAHVNYDPRGVECIIEVELAS